MRINKRKLNLICGLSIIRFDKFVDSIFISPIFFEKKNQRILQDIIVLIRLTSNILLQLRSSFNNYFSNIQILVLTLKISSLIFFISSSSDINITLFSIFLIIESLKCAIVVVFVLLSNISISAMPYLDTKNNIFLHSYVVGG